MDLKEGIIDTHAHLDDPRFDGDRAAVLERAWEAGIEAILTVGCWSPGRGFGPVPEIVAGDRRIFGALGVHPHDAGEADGDEPFELIERLAGEGERFAAVGETGLDYHYDNSPRQAQRRIFGRHIRLARKLGLPLVIHSREADDDTLSVMEEEGAAEVGGVMHCFSGGVRLAEAAMEMGFHLSFSGVVTFPGAVELRETAASVPVERMLVETDCPYLAPAPHRGRRNEPAYVVETVRALARIKGLSPDDVARVTALNARTLFAMGGRGGRGAEQEARIAYAIRNSLYLNITNRCTNYCTFCAKFRSYTVKGHYLRLRREPTYEELLGAIGPDPAQRYDEIVFCGYGEPLIRMELVKKLGRTLRKMGCRIRIDTDGLANLVHGRNVLKELAFVDTISVSMNAPDSKTYQRLVRTPFGDRAFPAILWFLREARKHVAKVVATVVAVPGLDIEACRRVAEDELGVGFRVREYNEVG
ncbi:MAG TPA: YchF/TatD family DNA exonuclease [Deltaproteobacteria bacterium]|nr:YchF/TatD family DNA exonuclease [Deltaproteobacteria bacterium]